MNSPILVSIASIIPGLGLLLLGERRQAIFTAILVIGLLFVTLISPWKTISLVSVNLLFLFWLFQGANACYDARLQKLIKKGSIQPAKSDTHFPPYPSGMSRTERGIFRAKRIIRHQLTSSEYVKEAVFADQTSFFRGICQSQHFYVGLSKNALIIVIRSFWGKPMGLVEIKFDHVEDIKVKYGLVYDYLNLSLTENRNGYKFRISRRLRKHTNKLVAEINKKRHIHPHTNN